VYNIIKGKSIPVQGWADPEGSRHWSLPEFKMTGTWRW